MSGLLLLVVFLVLLACGVYIAAAVGIAAFVGLYLLGDVPLVVLAQTIARQVGSPVLIAIPLFLLMGEIMNAAGISRRLFRLAETLVGHMTGGLAQVNVVASTLMSGLSGSSNADAALTTKVYVPLMKRAGYPAPYSGAVTAAAACIAPIIPPSIGMIIYASLANVSVGRLFFAGVLPGLYLSALLLVTVWFISRRRGYGGKTTRVPVREVGRAVVSASWALVLPIVIVGGIRIGVFTATEAAAVGVVYAVFIGAVVYRELKLRDLPAVLLDASVSIGVIMLIIGAAAPITWFLGVNQIPQQMANQLLAIADPLMFLLMVNVALLLAGTFMEETSLLILTTPLLAPAAAAMGIDPAHFGLIILFNIIIGAVTPPFGNLVFTVSAVGGISSEAIFRELFRFLVPLLLTLGIITFLPESYMWFVERFGP